MKSPLDPTHALASGLARIRAEFQVPAAFPPEVLAAAASAAARAPAAHVDRTSTPFVTLDPAASVDLDQAFAIERSGADLILHYAIADVAWFVEPTGGAGAGSPDGAGPVDAEAWRRGETLYLPDGRAGLYPPVLSEGAASLLPDGPRPAILFATRIAPDGEVRLEGTERAIVRSRAKLAYDAVRDEDLPPDFAELAERIAAAEARRGASRVDPPEQEVRKSSPGFPGEGDRAQRGGGDHFELAFRPLLESERRNAAMSLATNLAVAQLLLAHHTGLFRVMAEPDDFSIARLRRTAQAFALDWPAAVPLADFERTLDPIDPRQAAFMHAIRRAGAGAGYAPFRDGIVPWHAAVAAPYVHATAPLRRLADRYVVMAALAVANGRPVPLEIEQAFARLPKVMARADAKAGQIERAVVDLAEAVMLQSREGEVFAAIVTDEDERGVRMQLRDLPIVTRIIAHRVDPGDELRVRLTKADPETRNVTFERIG
jgi:exoribonuclease R